MTIIKLTDIKKNTFDIDNLIETSFNESLPTVISSLENMKSALFFKQQKLKKDLLEISNKNFPLSFINQLKSLKVEREDINSLEKNSKKVLKIKIMLKILTIRKQIDKSDFNSLNNLLESDNPTDWEFLSYFFQTVKLKENQLNEFKRKMVDKFEKSLNLNISLLIKIYDVMNRLNSVNLLVNVYLSTLPIFNLNKEDKNYKKIEIINFKGDWFSYFLKTLESSFKTDDFLLFNKNFKLLIAEKLFNETVSANLDVYLNEEDCILFLIKLKDSFIQMHDFIKKIKVYDIDIEIWNLFEHHKNIAIRKEIQGIEKIFNILNNKIENNLYFINGKICKKEDIFNNFLCLIFYYETIKEREDIFSYENSDIKFIRNKFFKTINDMLIITEDFKGLNILTKIYLVLKKYLIDFPTDFLEEKMLKIYRNELKKSLKIFNNLIYKLSINNLKTKIELIVNEIELIKKNCIEYLKGKNGLNFLKIILENLQNSLLKFILKQIIKEKDMREFKQSFEPIILEFMDLEIENILSKVLSIVCSEARVLSAVIKVSKLEVNEVKKYLKVREDYNEIKKELI